MKIKIFSQDWEIVFNKDIYELHSADGMCFFNAKKIHINPNQSRSEIIITIIHESLHAILNAAGYKDLATDEIFIHTLSECLYITYSEQFNNLLSDTLLIN